MEQESMAGKAAPTRPSVVKLVGIVLYIWAAIAAAESLSLFLNRNDENWVAVYGSSDEILTAALIQGAMALAFFAVGYGIMSGVKWARIAVAVVVGFRLVELSWFMLTHLGRGAFTWSTMISLGLSLFVLWALYGKDESIRYYEGYA